MPTTEKTLERANEKLPLLIFPFNGNGIEAVDCAHTSHRVIGFVDDEEGKWNARFNGISVTGRAALAEFSESQVLAVPGSPTSFRIRQQLIDGLEIRSERFATVIHCAASISPCSTIGFNFLAMAGTVVTSNASIGNHVCILPNSVVHHDATVGDWTLIGSNVSIAGGVRVGENCYIGSGSSIKNGVVIGDGALIGLGSTVIYDVPAGGIVAGNPAREICKRSIGPGNEET